MQLLSIFKDSFNYVDASTKCYRVVSSIDSESYVDFTFRRADKFFILVDFV